MATEMEVNQSPWPSEEAAYAVRQQAHQALQSREYSLAIELLLQAIAYDPGRRLTHDRLLEAAYRRATDSEASQGTVPPMTLPLVDPAVARLIEVQRRWAYAPLDSKRQTALMEQLLVSDRQAPELGLRLIARWLHAELNAANQRVKRGKEAGATAGKKGDRTVA